MAELYQVATGSKKISNLATISGISGSAVIPVVMSNVVGGTYPITNGTTNQISYQDFRESVIENNANTFTTTQTINLTDDGVILDLVASNNKKRTTLEGHDFIMSTGSLTEVGFDGGEGFKVELFKNDGVKLYTLDNTEAVPANGFKTFMEIETGYGDVTFTRPVSFDGALTVNDNLTVNGVLTARQVQTSIVTSSVQYESGSTRFGDTTDDTHEFTGSLKTSGSISLNSLTNNGIVYANSNGELVNSSNLTFNGSILGVNATSINTTAYVNINNNGLKVDGTINNALIGAVTTSLINQNTSQGLVNNLTNAVTSSLINQNTSQAGVNLGISIVTASINGFTSSLATSAANINSFTASQLAVNTLTQAVTSSLITIVGGLQSYTASLKNVALVSSSNQLFELNNQTGSQNSINTLTQAVTSSLITIVGGLQSYTASLKSVGLVSSSNQLFELNNQTGSQNSINTLTSAVTSSLINIVGGIQSYTASLKGQAIVSSSTQISNYYKFAETASANIFYGDQTISGSLRVTSSVNLSGSVVINGFTYPTFGFADGQYGVEVPTLAVNNTFSMEVPRTVYEYVKNDSGATLLKGTPVHATDVVGFNSMVIAASASNAATMPATYILAQDLDDQEEGLGIAIGHIQGVDTTGLQAGQPVWVGANGGWTQTKPTGSNLIQNLGIVTKVGSNGGGVVLGAGRTNDVPNISEGYFWVGNSGSVATAFPTSSFELSGRGVVSSSNQLGEIAGLQSYTASLKNALTINGNNDVTFAGKITAQEFTTVYTTSSVLYQSGSTKFGDTVDDKHEFTGSLSISGSDVYLQNGDITIAKTAIGASAVVGNIDFKNDYMGNFVWAQIQGVNGATHDFSNISFSTTYGFNTLTEKVRITDIGNLNVLSGSVIMGTSGKGIDFSATPNGSGTTTSELLNDYEEGIFTPTIVFGTSGTPTYAIQSGFYTKIGRQVTVVILISFNDNTGSGTVSIGGLPFTSLSTNYCRATGNGASIGLTGMTDGIQFIIPQNSTQIDMYYANDGVSTQATNANTSTDTDIYCTLTYFTA